MPTTTSSTATSFGKELGYNFGNGVDASAQTVIAELAATPDQGIVKGFKTGERARIIGTNLAGDTVEEFTTQFERNAASRTDIKNPVRKITVHNKPGDILELHESLEMCLNLIDKLGYKNCPYVIVEHREKEHQHFHILLSRIDFDGQVISDKYDYLTLRKWARETEQKYNLTPTAERSARRSLTRAQIEKHSREETVPPFYQLQAHIDVAVNKPIPEFIEHLESKGVGIKFRFEKAAAVGVSFSFMERNFAGGHLGTDFDWQGLQNRGLDYEPVRDNAEMAAASGRAGERERMRTINKTDDAGEKHQTGRPAEKQIAEPESSVRTQPVTTEVGAYVSTEPVRDNNGTRPNFPRRAGDYQNGIVAGEDSGNRRGSDEEFKFDDFSNIIEKSSTTDSAENHSANDFRSDDANAGQKTVSEKTAARSAAEHFRAADTETLAHSPNIGEPIDDKFEQTIASANEIESQPDSRQNAAVVDSATNLRKKEFEGGDFIQRKSGFIAVENSVGASSTDRLPASPDQRRSDDYRPGQMDDATVDRRRFTGNDSIGSTRGDLPVDIQYGIIPVDTVEPGSIDVRLPVGNTAVYSPAHGDDIAAAPAGDELSRISISDGQTSNGEIETCSFSAVNKPEQPVGNNQNSARAKFSTEYDEAEEFIPDPEESEKVFPESFEVNSQEDDHATERLNDFEKKLVTQPIGASNAQATTNNILPDTSASNQSVVSLDRQIIEAGVNSVGSGYTSDIARQIIELKQKESDYWKDLPKTPEELMQRNAANSEAAKTSENQFNTLSNQTGVENKSLSESGLRKDALSPDIADNEIEGNDADETDAENIEEAETERFVLTL